MLNMHHFNVNQLNTLIRYAIHFTDFDTEGLSRDIGKADASNNLTPDFIHSIFPGLSTLCLEYATSGKIIDENVIKNHLNFNSHGWCRVLKYTFQNTTLIDKSCMQSEKNWLQFSSATMKLCFAEANMNDSAEDSDHKDDLFSKYIKYPNIAGEFRNFIGQLIKDGFIKEAKAIHEMLKYSRKIVTNPKNGVNAEKLSTLISIVFFNGLELFEGNQRSNTKQKTVSMAQPELYSNFLKVFSPGFAIVLEEAFFSEDFSAELYLGMSQQYPGTALKKSRTDVMAGVITENFAKLTLSNSDHKLVRKKSVEPKKENKVPELRKSSGTGVSTSGRYSSLSHISTSPRIINSSSITPDTESTSPKNSPKPYELETQSITQTSKESFDFERGNKAHKLRKSESPIRVHNNSTEHPLKKSDQDLSKSRHKIDMPTKDKECDIGKEVESTFPKNSPKMFEMESQSQKSKEPADYEWGRTNKLRKSESPARERKVSKEHPLKKSDPDLSKNRLKIEMPTKEKEYDIGQENNSSLFLIKHTKKSPRRSAVDAFVVMSSDNELVIQKDNSTGNKTKVNEFKNTM